MVDVGSIHKLKIFEAFFRFFDRDVIPPTHVKPESSSMIGNNVYHNVYG